jgi:hypothetical protein
VQDPAWEKDSHIKTYSPYEQDMTNYPEIYKIYGQNYDRYERAKKKFYEEDEAVIKQGEDLFTREKPKDMSPWEKKYDMLMPKFTGTSAL